MTTNITRWLAVFTTLLTIGIGLSPRFSRGEVLFTLEPSNILGIPTRSFGTNNGGHILQINVYAESTETNDTGRLRWTLVTPNDLPVSGLPQPNPYVGGSNDFFYPYPMSIYNYTYLTNNFRAIAYGSTGPKNKKGLIGVYRFSVSPTTDLGPRVFRVINTEAYSTNYNPDTFSYEPQASSGSQVTVEIVPNYDVFTNGTKIFMDVVKSPDVQYYVPYLFAEFHRGPYAIEASSDLENWHTLLTNTFPEIFVYTQHSFRDDSATNFPIRFYRARVIAP